MPATKIATCCYCGSRTMLELRGTTHHELTCGNCGAPLRYIKLLRKEAPEPRHSDRDVGAQGRHKVVQKDRNSGRQKAKKKSKSRGMMHFVLSRIADEIEDIFD